MTDSKADAAQLAAEAEAYFNESRYEQALQALQQVQSRLKDKEDPRLAHNFCLIGCARNGYGDVDAIRSQLTAIKERIRIKAAKAKEGADASSHGSAAAAAGGKQTDGRGALDAEALGLIAEAEADTSILLYNLAALHFDRKEYGSARTILEHLFRNIEPIEEHAAVHICLLLVDVLIHTYRGNMLAERECKGFAQQTDQIFQHVDKVQHMAQSSGVSDAGSAAAKTEAAGDAQGTNAEHQRPAVSGGEQSPLSTELNFRIHIYRAKVALLLSQVKVSKKELKTALELYQQSKELWLSASQQNGLADGSSGTSSSAAPAMRNMTMLYLKANFEYLRQNYQKALKLLSSTQHDTALLASDGASGAPPAAGAGTRPVREGLVGALYFNNVGCVHHKMRRYGAALVFFQKALKMLDQQKAIGGLQKDGRVLPAFECEIHYNAAMQLLQTDRPQEALRHFKHASSLMYNRPQLWLRMAECCLRCEQRGCGLTLSQVGSGAQRRALLVESPAATVQPRLGAVDAAFDENSLAFAARCLQNALSLCATLSSIAAKESERDDKLSGLFGKKSNQQQPGDKESQRQSKGSADAVEPGTSSEALEATKLMALVNLAFVQLSLGDPMSALAAASDLLADLGTHGEAERGQGPSLKLLAHLYAAEALCLLNRPLDALEHVLPGGSALEAPATGGGPEDRSDAQLRTSILATTATVQTLQGNALEAEESSRKALELHPSSPDALRARVFVLLRAGARGAALSVLRDFRTGVVRQA